MIFNCDYIIDRYQQWRTAKKIRYGSTSFLQVPSEFPTSPSTISPIWRSLSQNHCLLIKPKRSWGKSSIRCSLLASPILRQLGTKNSKEEFHKLTWKSHSELILPNFAKLTKIEFSINIKLEEMSILRVLKNTRKILESNSNKHKSSTWCKEQSREDYPTLQFLLKLIFIYLGFSVSSKTRSRYSLSVNVRNNINKDLVKAKWAKEEKSRFQ